MNTKIKSLARQPAGQPKKPVYSYSRTRGQISFSERMENEFMNRGYLLPDGCKDLKDAWEPKGPAWAAGMMPLPHIFTPEEWKTMSIEKFFKAFNTIQSKFKGELTVPEQMSVLELATMLNKNMSEIFNDLVEIGGLAAVKEQLDFVTISKVAWKYGFVAKKAKE